MPQTPLADNAPAPSALRRLQAGQEVDEAARGMFANGRLILHHPHPQKMATLTAEAITNGAETLFQATFAAQDLLVKADVLTQTAQGWQIKLFESRTARHRAIAQLHATGCAEWDAAQVVWEEMIGEGETAVLETAVKQQMVKQLLAYCHLDTLAMVGIHYVLLGLATDKKTG